jgi:hypothetical protein
MPICRPVIVTQADGTQTRYDAVRDVQRALGLHPPTVHRALKDGKPLYRADYRGWSFRYADEDGASPLPAPLAQEVEEVVARVEVEAPSPETPKPTYLDFLEQARVKPR